MRLLRTLILAVTVLVGIALGQSPAGQSQVAVVSDQGQPIKNFEVMVNTADVGCSQWEKGEQGIENAVLVTNSGRVLDLLIRAEGYANTIVRFEGKGRDELLAGKGRVMLHRGKPIEIHFQLPPGISWPDDYLPDVYFAGVEFRVSMMQQPNNRKVYETQGLAVPEFSMLVKRAGANTFKVRLADDSPPFYVGIHRPGFLKFFQAGPFTAQNAKDGKLNIEVPKAAQLNLRFDTSTAKDGERPKDAMLTVLKKRPGTSDAYLEVGREKFESAKDASLSFSDLVPGEYRYQLLTDIERTSGMIREEDVQPIPFHDVGVVSLDAGEAKTVEIKFAPLDRNVTHGDRTAIIHITKPNKEAAAGKKVIVAYVDRHYGRLVVFDGEVPASSVITLKNIAQGKIDEHGFGGYTVQADGQMLGCFGFSDGEMEKELHFRLPLAVGDRAPNLDLIDVSTGKHMHLADFRGKPVWLEFWATWCGPCQPAMEELVKDYDAHRKEWDAKVAVIPVSVDETRETVAHHTKDRGWDIFQHYWSERCQDRYGFDSTAASEFGINGVPTAFIIGGDGSILWKGHPMAASKDRSLLEFINTKVAK